MDNPSYFLGIDISKEWIDVALFLPSKPRSSMPTCRFDNANNGFDKLADWLQDKHQVDLSTLFVSLEHTGVYSVPLCRYLETRQIQYSLVEGLKIKYSMGIRREKTDEADAKVIARYTYKEFNELPIRRLSSENIQKLAHLMSYRERLKKLKHSLTVAAKELTSFVDIPDLEQCLTTPSKNISTCINKAMKQAKKDALAIINQDPAIKRNYDLITSVPGIAYVIGTYMIITTGNFTRFQNHKQYNCYVGCAPFKKQSGSSIRGKTKVSHFANKQMKALLTNGARSAVNNSPEMNIFYQRKMKQGKEDYCVINIIRTKLVSRAFAVIKRGTPYVETFAYNTISKPKVKEA